MWSTISAFVITVFIGTIGTGRLRLPHAVADNLPAAKFHFFAIDGSIVLDLDDEIGIGKTDAVANRWTEHIRISVSFDFWHTCLNLQLAVYLLQQTR